MADIDASQCTQCSNFYIPTLLAFVCGFCHYINNMATDTPDTLSLFQEKYGEGKEIACQVYSSFFKSGKQ